MMADHPELEEALRLAEIGEYLHNKSYSYGDGYTEPREYGIDWQWQQSKPDEFGEGVLLAEAVKWHAEMVEDGITTEATKLRASLAAKGEQIAALKAALKDAETALFWAARQHHEHGNLRAQKATELSAQAVRAALKEKADA